MARFTVTIQLQDARHNDFEKLHRELEKKLFTQEKVSSSESKDYLSKREYTLEGNITLQEVNAALLKAAASTGKEYSFIVMRNKTTNPQHLIMQKK